MKKEKKKRNREGNSVDKMQIDILHLNEKSGKELE